jgi:ABC-type multidrug transport system fused ATPase/permease subunit
LGIRFRLSSGRRSFLRAPFALVADNRLALLNTLVMAIVALALAKGVFYYYQQVMAAQVGQRTAADLRLDLYRHLQRLSFSFHDRRRTGDMLARLTSDIRFLRVIFVSLPIRWTGSSPFCRWCRSPPSPCCSAPIRDRCGRL